jgi:hypothetical protein
MAKAAKTSKKRPTKPFRGAVDGVPFSKNNQPASELKVKGWEQWRKERNLTQAVIKELLGEDGAGLSFKEYIGALIKNAKAGNPKAIDAVNKCLEDEIIKVAATNAAGDDVNFRIIALDPLILPDDTGNDSTT